MKRIVSLDYARGFTVVIMAPVHTVLMYSNDDVQKGLLGDVLRLLAEGHGAQVLMTLMGIGIVGKKHQSLLAATKRSSVLLALGYLLNAAKFLLPLVTVGLPIAFLGDQRITPNNEGMLQLFLIGDILHFAAIAYLITWTVTRTKDYYFIALILMAAIIIIAPFLYCNTNAASLNNVTAYFIGSPPQVYFPAFPWLIYPLLGLTIGYLLKRRTLNLFARFKTVGGSCCLIGFAIDYIDSPSPSFYQPAHGACLMHIGIVLLSLYVWHWISLHIPSNKFLRGLQLISKHVTLVYCLQWILICWLLPLIGYQSLDISQSFLAILMTTSATLIITYLISTVKYGAKSI